MSFFEPEGEGFRATAHTTGPWSPDHQHGGPPIALLGRAFQRFGGGGRRVVRVTADILRPVPVAGHHALHIEVVRPGKRVQLLSGTLSVAEEVVIRASCLRIRQTELPLQATGSEPPAKPPEDSAPFVFPFFATEHGYHHAMELRIAEGTFGQGPTQAWLRMRRPLLPDEEPSGLQRALIAADSGNGVSAVLDWRKWLFVNPDLSVTLFRDPAGEWVCLDARTDVTAEGVGLASSILSDRRGAFGRAQQTLFVDRR